MRLPFYPSLLHPPASFRPADFQPASRREEIEAYLRGGVLTHAGLAFSRDTSAKVYIQHKMLEDGALLSSLLTAPEEKDKGYFYLCGPTWPVPDVYEALVGSIDGSKGVGRERAEAMIEEFKEAERYVLEVY